jgi:hypothetical protein
MLKTYQLSIKFGHFPAHVKSDTGREEMMGKWRDNG